MARPQKVGLNYFSKDINYYDDYKMIDLLNQYGPLGQTIYDVLVTLIYRQGYYIEAAPELLSNSVIRLIGNRWIKEKQTVMQVVHYCADIGLFDNDLLSQNVITSVEIQQQYADVVKRRQFQNGKYWLLENDSGLISEPETPVNVTETRVNVTETPVIVYNNATNKSKVNKTKVNKTKVNKTKTNKTKTAETISEDSVGVVVDFFNENMGSISSTIVDDITDYLARGYEDKLIIECIRKAVFVGKSTWGYVKGILSNLEGLGIKTLEQFKSNGKKSKNPSAQKTSYDINELDEFWNKVPVFEKSEVK